MCPSSCSQSTYPEGGEVKGADVRVAHNNLHHGGREVGAGHALALDRAKYIAVMCKTCSQNQKSEEEGWVVNSKRGHTGRQGELIPCGHGSKTKS